MPDRTQTQKSNTRCLWLTRIDPRSPDAGDLTYSFHLLASLARSGVAVTVLATARWARRAQRPAADGIEWVLVAPQYDDAELRGRLAPRSLFGRLPNVAARYKTRAFRRELRIQLAREWDAIVLDHLGTGWTLPWVRAYQRRNPDASLVFIAHQCEADARWQAARNFRGSPLRKFGLHLDALKAGLLEREIIRCSTLFSVITAADQCRFGSSAKSVLLTPGYAGARVASRTITTATPRRALIFGSALWIAKQMNLVDFVAASDDLFWRNQIELWVVGKVPDHLRTRSHHSATRFLGFVDDPQPIFSNVRIGIVAERTGGGFKLKSLDYIFNRVPMFAIRGSLAGLPLTPNKDYFSFTSIGKLAHGVVTLIDDFDRLNSLQEAAYAKCGSAFDWSERGRILHEAIQEAVRPEAILLPTANSVRVG
jgi:polysaccharide biosynthesis protein PslH